MSSGRKNHRWQGRESLRCTAVLLLLALLCRSGPAGAETGGVDEQLVLIGGRHFLLEIADDPRERTRGLRGRTALAGTGGMLFVFPSDAVRVQTFLMRDCLIDLDLIFLDVSGRIVALHSMRPEAPRGPGEGRPGDIVEAYDQRLARYSSGRPAQFAIELEGGTLARLALAVGDVIDLPRETLAARAR